MTAQTNPDQTATQPLTGLVRRDPWLEPHNQSIQRRIDRFNESLAKIDSQGGLHGEISSGHCYFGFQRGEYEGTEGLWYREWAPAAHHLALVGDFNNWDFTSHPMRRDEWGVWSIFLPDSEYADRITHLSRLKVHICTADGAMDRIPAYIRRVVQPTGGVEFVGEHWAPESPYQWQNEAPKEIVGGLRIYEAHAGMAQEDARVGTFDEFTDNILPRIKALGYNAIQLMAIMEHPYYGSFGYHVSNFFAASSRFGTPYDLKRLVDAAHGMGIKVIMDLVHSHCVKNINEGLNKFDGTEYQYFHAGPRGRHVAWDSLCFDYSKYEVQRFLLSNIRFWMEEFRFDGFRFDGITSMLYLDHGLGRDFTSYDDYYNANVDDDAVNYLMLANSLMKQINPHSISISEDMSGMPGMAVPVEEGGLGFDYRLAMGVPDFWIKMLKERPDEDWNLEDIFHTLMNRRSGEKHVGYVESHDQALVGDKTTAMWLMDKELYDGMSVFTQNPVVSRGIALHKIIRLLTFTLAGEGYLNFMGNEFGHPEWIDFPREGNNYSHQYARRQWSLVDTEHLRYKGLCEFDRALQQLDEAYNLLNDSLIEHLFVREDEKLLVYRRGPLVFLINLHPTESYEFLKVPVPDPTDYRIILNSDDKRFGGFGLVDEHVVYPKRDDAFAGREQSLLIYLPARTSQVIAPVTA